MIKSIIAETGADVDVNDEGKVFISSQSDESIQKAKSWIEGMMHEIEAGEEFKGKVVSYGAFVNLTPGKDGLLHVSNMSTEFVKDISTLVKLGDELNVRVISVDPEGKISLTTLTPEQEAENGATVAVEEVLIGIAIGEEIEETASPSAVIAEDTRLEKSYLGS
jgi:polyribonucleotide nucleotidyltransferase